MWKCFVNIRSSKRCTEKSNFKKHVFSCSKQTPSHFLIDFYLKTIPFSVESLKKTYSSFDSILDSLTGTGFSVTWKFLLENTFHFRFFRYHFRYVENVSPAARLNMPAASGWTSGSEMRYRKSWIYLFPCPISLSYWAFLITDKLTYKLCTFISVFYNIVLARIFFIFLTVSSVKLSGSPSVTLK